MDIEVQWAEPIELVNGVRQRLIYALPNVGLIPDGPGVYVFGRQFGEAVAPIYVGQAQSLTQRVEQQLNNVRLMKGLESYPSGTRILLYGELLLKRGQRLSRVLDVVEAALIEYALAEDHILLNKQGTKTPTHTLSFRGNHASRQVAPLRMKVRAG
jgi:hypothetical protein